jgi:phage-related protein
VLVDLKTSKITHQDVGQMDMYTRMYDDLIRDGLYELRVEYNGNIYRVCFIFDEGNIIVLFNGFQKKTQKMPLDEIKKVLKIKENYYADKQSQNC